MFNADYHRHGCRERRWFRYSKLGLIALGVVAQFGSKPSSGASALGNVLGGALAGLIFWSIFVAPVMWVVFRLRRPAREGADSLAAIRAEGLVTEAECDALIAAELNTRLDQDAKVEAARVALLSARAVLAELGGAEPPLASSPTGEPVRPADAPKQQHSGSQYWSVLNSLWWLGIASLSMLMVVGAMQPPHRSRSDENAGRSSSSGTETRAQLGPRFRTRGVAQPGPSRPPPPRPREPELRSVRWVINVGNHPNAYVSADGDAAEMYTRAAASRDDEAMAGLLVSGRVFPVPSGTHVMILENGWLSKRIRVLGGDKAGQEGLIPSEHLKAE